MAINKIEHKEVEAKIILADIGMITETDVTLAKASNAILIGFNVKPNREAKKLAEEQKIDIKYFNIIYEALDYVEKTLSGLLEPDIKEGPGGFRDLQTLIWIAKKNFKTNSLFDLHSINIITKKEYLALLQSERFLSKTRFLLHYLNNKPEERLYFTSQKKLAELFGHNCKTNLGVEKFMQNFYKHITNIKQLNEILVKHIENPIDKNFFQKAKIINKNLYVHDNILSVKNIDVFKNDPSKIFEVYL